MGDRRADEGVWVLCDVSDLHGRWWAGGIGQELMGLDAAAKEQCEWEGRRR